VNEEQIEGTGILLGKVTRGEVYKVWGCGRMGVDGCLWVWLKPKRKIREGKRTFMSIDITLKAEVWWGGVVCCRRGTGHKRCPWGKGGRRAGEGL